MHRGIVYRCAGHVAQTTYVMYYARYMYATPSVERERKDNNDDGNYSNHHKIT